MDRSETEAPAEPLIHPTAIVDPSAELGQQVRVGAYAIVGPEVRLGDGTQLFEHAVVTNGAYLGKGNRVHHHAVIGGVPQDLKFDSGERSQLVIGDNNVLREFVTVNSGTQFGGGVTRVGNNNLVMTQAHIAHDCQIGDGIVIGNNTMLAGHVLIEDFVTIGGGCAVQQFSTLGRYAYLAGFTRVVQDVPPFLTVEGYGCKIRGVNYRGMQRFGYSKQLIEQLKHAFRLIFRSGAPRARALELLEARPNIPEEVRELVAFLRRSEKGKSGRFREVLRARDYQSNRGAADWQIRRGAIDPES